MSIPRTLSNPRGSEQAASANRKDQVSHTSQSHPSDVRQHFPPPAAPRSLQCQAVEEAREPPSPRGAASSPISHQLLTLDRSVLCSFQVLNQIQLDFQGSAAPKPLTQCWFMVLGEQAGIITSCMISICFVPNYSHLVLPFYNTRGKKSHQLALNLPFLPGQGRGEATSAQHLRGYGEVSPVVES